MTNAAETRHVPADAANLFNPAYCCAILHRIATGHKAAAEKGLPYVLAFIAIPVAMHPTSAATLPSSAQTRLHNWILNNPEVLVGFADRSRSMAPFVRDAISFGLQFGLLKLVEPDLLVALNSKLITKWDKRPYNLDTSKQAQVLGKLLAQMRDLPTVFTLFGVRP